MQLNLSDREKKALSPERLLTFAADGTLRTDEAAIILCPSYIRQGPARTKLIEHSKNIFQEYKILLFRSTKVDHRDLRYFAQKLRAVWDLDEDDDPKPGGVVPCEEDESGATGSSK